jgi:hypothetical protein
VNRMNSEEYREMSQMIEYFNGLCEQSKDIYNRWVETTHKLNEINDKLIESNKKVIEAVNKYNNVHQDSKIILPDVLTSYPDPVKIF